MDNNLALENSQRLNKLRTIIFSFIIAMIILLLIRFILDLFIYREKSKHNNE